MLCSISAGTFSPCNSAEAPYNLGTVRVELIPEPSSRKFAIPFRLMNTSGSPVRYFSITCKVLKDGHLIDERIVNGFGIEPNGSKDLFATFLWLPPFYTVEFEANAIRMDPPYAIRHDHQKPKMDAIPSSIGHTSHEEDPMALIDSPYKVGEKYTIFNENGWVTSH